MYGSDGSASFRHELTSADINKTLAEGGFNYTVSIDTASAVSARTTFDDPRAYTTVDQDGPGWTGDADDTCLVNIVDFCLDDAYQVDDTQWAFNFTIRASSSPSCGDLSAELSIVLEDYTWLGNVQLPSGNDIIDTFNCDCVKTFTVTADYDGTPGDIYGQLDIRSSQGT